MDGRWREVGDKGAVRFLDSDIGVIRGGSFCRGFSDSDFSGAIRLLEVV